MNEQQVHLTGLDGSNPLAFMAALGLLRVLDEKARREDKPRPRLTWEQQGCWIPVLGTNISLEEIVAVVIENKDTWKTEPALSLAYTKEGKEVAASEDNPVRDLKPPLKVMKKFLEDACAASTNSNRRSVDQVAAYGSELIPDNKGNTKPSALHFTAGQQTFLGMVDELRKKITREDLSEALIGPWTGESILPSLSWDNTVTRLYALRAGDPSKEKRGSVPGADWLAFIGLSFFPVAPVGRKLETTCVRGRWKDGKFTWPLWSVPATLPTIRSLLGTASIEKDRKSERDARGIAVVFSCVIGRSDQGGYGSFSPARVV